MKTVFSSDMVAHTWAQNSQSVGRNSAKSLWFNGGTLYSYRTAIAKFVGVFEGSKVVMLSTSKHSITTSGHQSMAYSALRGHIIRVFAPSIQSNAGYSETSEEWAYSILDTNIGNLAAQRAACELILKIDVPADIPAWLEAFKARKAEAERIAARVRALSYVSGDLPSHVVQLAKLATPHDAQKNQYTVDTLKKARRVVLAYANALDVATDAEAIKALKAHALNLHRTAKAWTVFLEAEKAAQLDRENVQELQDFLSAKLKFKDAFSIEWMLKRATRLAPELLPALYAKIALCHALEEIEPAIDYEALTVVHKRKARMDYASSAEKLAAWLAGKSVVVPQNTPTRVRRKDDRLQTSRGAECPWSHAVAIFRKAQACRINGSTWHRNGEHLNAGVFEVDCIYHNGTIVAGCHTIEFAEMERLALQEVPDLVRPRYPVPALIAA